MITIQRFMLAATLVAASASAAAADAPAPAPDAWHGVRLQAPPAPSQQGIGPRVLTDLVVAAPPAAPAGPDGAPAAPAPGTTGAQALPPVPAAQPEGPAAPTPSPSVPAASSEHLPAALVPGQPVKTYSTLSDAAKDGIDPLKERVAVAALPPVGAGARPFDFRDPHAYLDWTLSTFGTKGLAALGAALVALMAVGVMRRR